MSDGYIKFVRSAVGSTIARVLGMPIPPLLQRYDGRKQQGSIAVCGSTGSAIYRQLLLSLDRNSLEYQELHHSSTSTQPQQKQRFYALVLDASEIDSVEGLDLLYQFFSGHIRALADNGRIIVLAKTAAAEQSYGSSVAQRALPGFVRSLAKELRGGSTAQLLSVESDADMLLDSTLAFILSPKSAYVNAQCIRIYNSSVEVTETICSDKPLQDRVALVTGASRGIGLAIAETLHRDGAKVICLDIPAVSEQLDKVASSVGGLSLPLDICDVSAGEQIVEFVRQHGGRLDCLVHNAGITRDKSLAAMSAEAWQSTLEVNLASPIRINKAVLESGVMPQGGRIVGVSSISGIAGNRGQSNYATSKAGVIGMVEAGHSLANSEGITFNSVAPGFIETEMTAKIPFAVRQVGRRMSSLNQGGLPVDVAETIAWLCHPSSGGVQANTVRVCGQNFLGA